MFPPLLKMSHCEYLWEADAELLLILDSCWVSLEPLCVIHRFRLQWNRWCNPLLALQSLFKLDLASNKLLFFRLLRCLLLLQGPPDGQVWSVRKTGQSQNHLIPTSTKGSYTEWIQSSCKWSLINMDCNLELFTKLRGRQAVISIRDMKVIFICEQSRKECHCALIGT